MRILVYIEKAEVRGGIEVFAERHVERLRADGHEVDVWHDLRDEDDPRVSRLASLVNYDEIIVHKCADVATLESFPPDKTTYYVHDYDPICPRSYAYTPLKRNCSRPSGIWPCIFCAPACRSWKAALSRVFSQGRRKMAMAKFRKIVVISEFMKGRLVTNGIPAEKVSVEPPRLDGLASASPRPCVEEEIDLLFVGQLIRGKGVQLLLEAMARMKCRRTLDVVGTGNMEGELKVMAERLGIADRVRWRGFQSNPQEWMRAAKCVVVPSFWQEPYGLVAAEAVALGRPVVAFAIGGLPEACHGKATLVPPGDVSALAEALSNCPR